MNGKKDKNIEYSSYIRQFWVGLMDGDGSLQVNHWRKKSLQYRLVIKLKNDPDKYNITLLQRIQKSIGGNVRIVSSNKFVTWVENHRSKISQILQIFEKYPPLTQRLYSQYLFYLESSKRDNIEWYLENRSKKYIIFHPKAVCDSKKKQKTEQDFVLSPFVSHKINFWDATKWFDSISNVKPNSEEESFKGWLSGFIEAEGCFTLRCLSSKVCSFSISQKGEPLLLQRINMFFGGQTKVRKVSLKKEKSFCGIIQNIYQKQNLYILEIYKKTVLEKILSHCTAYPLYGEKQRSFYLFKKHLYKCRVVLPLWK